MRRVIGNIWIDGTEYSLDDLELGEVAEFEDMTGTTLENADWTSAKTLIPIVWIIKRRSDPAFTQEDAGKVRYIEATGLEKVAELRAETEAEEASTESTGDAPLDVPLAEGAEDAPPVPVSA